MSRGADDRPAIEVVDLTGRSTSTHPAPRTASRAAPGGFALLVMAAVLALFAGGLVLGSDHGPAPSRQGGPGSEASGTASQRAAAPGSTTTVVVAGTEGPVFGAPAGASLLMGSSGGGWRYLDLDTGVVQDIPALEGADPPSIVPVRGGVVVLHPVTGVLPQRVSLPDGSQSDLLLPRHPARPAMAVGVLPGPDSDHVWVLWERAGPEPGVSRVAVLTTTGGAVAGDEVDVPASSLLATAAGPVFGVGGRTYLSGPDGARLLAHGTPHAASATDVAVLTCDDQARCAPAIVEVASGVSRAGAVMPVASDSSLWMSLAPDGRLATIPTSVGSARWAGFGYGPPSVAVSVTSPAGVTVSVDVRSLRSEPVWLPGDLGLVAVTGYGVTRIFDDGGRLATERVPAVSPQRDDCIFVIPHR